MEEGKNLVLREVLGADVNQLVNRLVAVCERHRRYRDYTRRDLHEALWEVLACFPVYRTYTDDDSVAERDRAIIEMAVAHAKRKNPATDISVFNFVRDVLLLRFPDSASEEDRQALTTDVIEGRSSWRAGPRCLTESVERVREGGDRHERDGAVPVHPQPHALTEPEHSQAGCVERCCGEAQHAAIVEQHVTAARTWVERPDGALHAGQPKAGPAPTAGAGATLPSSAVRARARPPRAGRRQCRRPCAATARPRR